MDERNPDTPSAPAPAKKKAGRPSKPPEDLLVNGTIRLTRAEWNRYYEVGGTEWLRKALSSARILCDDEGRRFVSIAFEIEPPALPCGSPDQAKKT